MENNNNTKEAMKGLFLQTLYSSALIIAHGVLAALLIFCIFGIERAVGWISDGEPMLFGRFPISYIFDFANFSVLIIFVFQTFVSVVKRFRE